MTWPMAFAAARVLKGAIILPTKPPAANPASPTPLYRRAMQAAGVGLAINVLLGVAKLVAGINGRSFALISDSVNSFGDSLTSVVVIGALWYAQRPPDDEHPYGHTRAEAVAAAQVAVVILMSAVFVGWEALNRLGSPNEQPAVWTLGVAAGNALIKESLYWYKRRIGKRTGSASMLASAWDHRSDALCSVAVLVGLLAVRFGGANYVWADSVAALVVVGMISISGVKLLMSSTSELLDPQADGALVDHIRRVAEETDQVRAVEKLWVRKTGLEYLADIHIEVDADLTVEAGHRIGHHVKDRLLERFATLRDVLVHLEPFPHVHGDGATTDEASLPQDVTSEPSETASGST